MLDTLDTIIECDQLLTLKELASRDTAIFSPMSVCKFYSNDRDATVKLRVACLKAIGQPSEQ
jgi:hypothetical protein